MMAKGTNCLEDRIGEVDTNDYIRDRCEMWKSEVRRHTDRGVANDTRIERGSIGNEINRSILSGAKS
jgi:hypothetical protein